MMTDNDEDFDPSLETLFTSDRYETVVFHHGIFSLSLLCSPTACTDYDLTGQIVWPAARLLADYIAENPHELANVRDVCELGSGLGLAGLTCGQLCPTVLTDHNHVVLKVLQQNANLNQAAHPIRCMQMDWANDAEIAAVKELSKDGQGFQLLLGADVCYSLNALPVLFRAASRLLSQATDAFFLLAYVSRSTALDKGVPQEARVVGLHLSEVPGTRRRVDGGAFEGFVYRLSRIS
eukprot:jgi/Botrbrau1/13652/Bobra.0292s0002.1